MSLLFCKGEVENTEFVFLGLIFIKNTNLSITSLLSIILPSVVLQRVELTTVAAYPPRPAQMAISLKAVGLRLFKTTKVVGKNTPKNVA